jgi:hypothetical protein
MQYAVDLVAHRNDSAFSVIVETNKPSEILTLAKDEVIKNNKDISRDSLELVKVSTDEIEESNSLIN